MANYFNHTHSRKRTHAYSQLSLSNLKCYTSYPTGTISKLSWSRNGRTSLYITIKRVKNGLFIFTSAEHGYLIPIEETQVTFGKRLWYRCPVCKRRCGVLYHAEAFACRKCVKPAYESQNGSQQEYLADKIREARRKLWGDKMGVFTNDLLESCRWFPKPPRIHHQRFEREKAKIMAIEDRFRLSIPAAYRHYIAS